MKIVEINAVPYGSTGMISRSIATLAKKNGESYFAYSWTKKRKSNVDSDEILIGGLFEKYLCMKLEHITGFIGCFSYFGTYKLLKVLNNIKPDVIHLNNLHESNLNLEMLFKYLRSNNIKIVWTLHDCWSFTGHCPHFDMINCNKWKKECFDCPIYHDYPKSIFDNSKKMFNIKKRIFNLIDENNMVIVAPSKWLAELVKKSFLKKYNVLVINNGIDLDVFKPIENVSFKKKHNCLNKTLLLGVSYAWNQKKGLDIFIRLSQELDSKFQIVLVGTDKKVDKLLPKNIISIHRTTSKEELVDIYNSADIFINPTREEVFGLVNVEAIACGTPVITFNTGGCPEIINDKCGSIVKKNNYEELKNRILELSKNNIKSENCINEAKKFNSYNKYNEYVELFKKISQTQ